LDLKSSNGKVSGYFSSDKYAVDTYGIFGKKLPDTLLPEGR